MDTIAHYTFSHHKDEECKKALYDMNNFKLHVKENSHSKSQFRISLYHKLFNDPNKTSHQNLMQFATCEQSVLWTIKPYQENPHATNFTATFPGTINNNVWSPPENEPQKSLTNYFKNLVEDLQDNIIPNAIYHLVDEDKDKVFKALKFKAKDTPTIDDIRSKITPCIKQGEFEDKLYNFEMKYKFNEDKRSGETKYTLDLFNEKGQEITSIHENVNNIENELVKATKFRAIFSPSLWIKDGMITIHFYVNEIAIMNRPLQQSNGPKKSAFSTELYSNVEEDDVCVEFEAKSKIEEMVELKTDEVHTNTIESSEEDDDDDDDDDDE
jgi:hypothetical protein